MKALILAAGMGRRLQPYTKEKPKAMVEIFGKPMILRVMDFLKQNGISGFIVNVHHHSEMLKEFLMNCPYHKEIEISDESRKLLNTGGAIYKALKEFDTGSTFLCYNVDVLSDICLNTFFNHHQQNGALATLAVKNRSTSRYLLADNYMQLTAWKNMKTNETIWCQHTNKELNEFAYSGIQYINRKMLPYLHNYVKEINQDVFSIIHAYLRIAKKIPIKLYDHSPDFWVDLGKSNDYPLPEIYKKYLPS